MNRKTFAAYLFAVLGGPIFAAPPAAAVGNAEPSALLGAAPVASLGIGPEQQTIVVTGVRERGTPLSDLPPLIQFDERNVRALGAGTVGELLDAIAAQTRGLSSGQIVLLNGRRISGFSEVNKLPPEAVERVDVLPEQVALSYGYRSDQRVINIILRPTFKAVTTTIEHGFTTEEGRRTGRASANILRVRGTGRWSIDAELQRDTALLESERDLAPTQAAPFDLVGNIGPGPLAGTEEVDPALSRLAGRAVSVVGVPKEAVERPLALQDLLATANVPNRTEVTGFRSLLPKTDRFAGGGTWSGFLTGNVTATLSAHLELVESEAQFGLPEVQLVLPAGTPFSPFGVATTLYRYGSTTPLSRDLESRSGRLGLVLGGDFGSWLWSATASYDRTTTLSLTDADISPVPLQVRLDARDPSFNPFAADLSGSIARERQRARAAGEILNVEFLTWGTLAALPAGPLALSATFAAQARSLESLSVRASDRKVSSLSRDRAGFQASLEIPIASEKAGVLPQLGTLSANLNLAVSDLSDFGTIRSLGYGFHWSPVKPLVLTGSLTDEDRAPTLQQLGDPLVVIPNARLFDFGREETVEVRRTEGGNRDLLTGNRRLLKLGLAARPFPKSDIQIQVDYALTRERNIAGTFPAVTPQIEAAFPDRFTRDANGRLVALDLRPVNFLKSVRDEVRWGATLSRPFAGDGELQAALFHRWRLRDTIVIREGVPRLDFLHGSAAGETGSLPAHLIDGSVNLYRRGLGGRVTATWQEGTAVGSASGQRNLRFSSLFTATLRLFADLDAQPFARNVSWLKKTRVSLAVDNIFNSRLSVRDLAGTTPPGYQSSYLDPLGRSVRIGIRKAF